MASLARQVLAEAIGTFALIFIGAGSVVALTPRAGSDPAAALVGIALATGLTIAVMVTATGHISGGHLNPAVTLGLYAAGRVKVLQAIAYIIAQLVGAAVAALILNEALLGAGASADVAAQHLGTPFLGANVTVGAGILIEAVLTFFLVFVVSGTAVDERTPAKIGGLAIGLTITLDILMGGAFTGAAMNPARYTGPALVSGFWGTKPLEPLVYWIGPILGGIIAGIVYTYGLYQPMHTAKDLGPGHEEQH